MVDGLGFPESPRWHAGLLHISDMGTGRVLTVDTVTGETAVQCRKVPGRPSGLAWDSDGNLLAVSMGRLALYRDDGGMLTQVADLTPVGEGWSNDAVMHPDGWLYVGATGRPANLLVVDPSGAVRVAAEDLLGPNGMVITPDGRTLIVAEFGAERLVAFDVAADGTLGDQRTWAQLSSGCTPDGICLDRSGQIWFASAETEEVRRVEEGGRVTASVTCSQIAFACMLGGPDRSTLFVCTAPGSTDQHREMMGGRVEAVPVDVPGAGFP